MASAIPTPAQSISDSAWTPCSNADFSRFCVSKDERIKSPIDESSKNSLRCVRLDTQIDLHIVSGDLRTFDQFIPGKAIFAALQIGGGFPTGHSPSLPICTLAQKLHLQHHLFCDTMHCQIASDLSGRLTGSLHRFALERNFRKFFGIEKFRGSQILVPHNKTGV